jgi:hypothetical protein
MSTETKEKGAQFVVFCDTTNKTIDDEYAEKIIASFRSQTDWEVKKDTRIWNDLREFSKGYSGVKRDPAEVVGIFRIANGLLEI